MTIKKRSIILISSILLLIVSISFVYAAFSINETKGDIKFKLGKIDYTLNGSFINDSLIVPGQNLVNEEFKLVNNSNIDTQIRFKISLQLFNGDNTYIDLLSSLEYLESFNLNQRFKLIDGYYYYYNNDLETNEEYEVVIKSNEPNIILFNELILDGRLVKNDYSNNKVKLVVNFEAKQMGSMKWEDFKEVVIG